MITMPEASPVEAMSQPLPVWLPLPTVRHKDDTPQVSRRDLIVRLAAVGASALAAALTAGASIEMLTAPVAAAASTRKFRYGMVVDTRTCVGCNACVVACKQENKTPPGVNYTVVLQQPNEAADDKPLFMTKPCFHCENPPCVDVCPVNATFKRERDGIVVVDYDRCIGCRYCITACPYGARSFDFGESYAGGEFGTLWGSAPSPEYGQYRERGDDASPIGNVRKCTFCMHLQDDNGEYDKNEGRWPACAKTCPAGSIHFGDFNDPDSDVSQLIRSNNVIRLKEELGAEPNLYYLI